MTKLEKVAVANTVQLKAAWLCASHSRLLPNWYCTRTQAAVSRLLIKIMNCH